MAAKGTKPRARRKLPARVREAPAPRDDELRYDQGLAFLRLYRALERAPGRMRRLKGLVDELGLGERRIRRFVKAVERAAEAEGEAPAFTIEKVGEPAVSWVKLAREEPWSVQSNLFQYAVLWAAGRWLASAERPLLAETAKDLLDQLRSQLSGAANDMAARVPTAFHYQPFGPKDYEDADLLDALLSATLRRRPLRVEWISRRGGVHGAEIEPYTIVMYKDGLYLYARFLDGDRASMRLLSIERLRSADILTDRTFEIPDGYDPRAIFASRLGLWEPTERPQSISLAFTSAAAGLVDARRWPGFVRWIERRDGRRTLVLKMAPNAELVSWILSWGPEVEVLAPKTLRRQVAEQLRAATALYPP